MAIWGVDPGSAASSGFDIGLGGGVGGLVSGGLSLLGGMFSNQASKSSALQQMAFQDAQTKQIQQWEETMSSTAHQREVKDLRAAGLNPILSATGGRGATTPAVSTPSGASYIARDVVTPALASAKESAQGILDAAYKAQQLRINEPAAVKADIEAAAWRKGKPAAEKAIDKVGDKVYEIGGNVADWYNSGEMKQDLKNSLSDRWSQITDAALSAGSALWSSAKGFVRGMAERGEFGSPTPGVPDRGRAPRDKGVRDYGDVSGRSLQWGR